MENEELKDKGFDTINDIVYYTLFKTERYKMIRTSEDLEQIQPILREAIMNAIPFNSKIVIATGLKVPEVHFEEYKAFIADYIQRRQP